MIEIQDDIQAKDFFFSFTVRLSKGFQMKSPQLTHPYDTSGSRLWKFSKAETLSAKRDSMCLLNFILNDYVSSCREDPQFNHL